MQDKGKIIEWLETICDEMMTKMEDDRSGVYTESEIAMYMLGWEHAIIALRRYPAEKGKWEERILENDNSHFRRRWYCSACGNWTSYGTTDYCPFCGAEMEEDK